MLSSVQYVQFKVGRRLDNVKRPGLPSDGAGGAGRSYGRRRSFGRPGLGTVSFFRPESPAMATQARADAPHHIIELALLGLLALLWGASYSFIKIGVATIAPVTLIAARTLIGGLLLVAIMRLRGVALPTDRATWGRFLVQACHNSVVPFTLIAWAEQSVDAGLATILNSTSPIFTFLLTLGLTRHEPATARKLFGIAAGLVGICLIMGVQVFAGVGRVVLAQGAIVLATVCYAGAAIFGRGFKGLDPMAPAAGSLLCGAVLLVPLSLAIDRPWRLAPSRDSILALVGLAVFSTAFALAIYFRLVQTLGSIGTTAQAYLRVPVGVAIGIVWLGETPTLSAWLGLGCVLAGVLAMTLPTQAPVRPLLRLQR
jgi:drug/metabolite transporter (DMT)-like permease